MAYVSGDLNLLQANVGHDGGSLWHYSSSADAVAVIIAAGYIDDGADKGMNVKDTVLIAGTDTGQGQVSVVDTSSNPSGDITMI